MKTRISGVLESDRLARWAQTMISNPRKVNKALAYSVIIMFLFVTLFPFYWLFTLALTPNQLISGMGPYPRGFNLTSFITVFQDIPFHVYIFNSIVIAAVTTSIVLLVGSLAGYAFGRFKFRARNPLLLLLLVVSYFPPVAFFVPLYQLLTGNVQMFGIATPDLYNSAAGIITPLSALTMPFAIFVLTVFFQQIPDGLEDAARIEGCTRLGALYRVIVPLSAPGVATAGSLTFIAVYNEFFFSFLMTDGAAENWAPLVWGITQYQTTATRAVTPYNLMAAASIVGLLPVAVLIYAAQDKIVSGLTAGALKE